MSGSAKVSPEAFARALLRKRIASVQLSDESKDGRFFLEAVKLENGAVVEFRGDGGYASHAECVLHPPAGGA